MTDGNAVSKLELPLSGQARALAAILSQDPCWSLSKSAIFVLAVVDVPEIERNAARIAAEAGITDDQLRKIVDLAKQVQSTDKGTVINQHTVSQVLLRRFSGHRGSATGLESYSVKYGLSKRLYSPKSIGKAKDFVKIDSDETERLWQKTETYMHDALKAVDAGTVLSSPAHVQTIKDAIALHFARGKEVLEAEHLLWTSVTDPESPQWSAINVDPISLFRARHNGLFPPSIQAAKEIVATDIQAHIKKMYDDGFITRLKIVDNFEKARDLARQAALQIVTAKKGEFVIGDSPTLTIDWHQQRVGVLDRVSFGGADTVILPLGPHHLAVLSNRSELIDDNKLVADQVNTWQAEKAFEYVWFRPGAEDQVVPLLERVRPPTYVRKTSGGTSRVRNTTTGKVE
jgi:hypothetical protein